MRRIAAPGVACAALAAAACGRPEIDARRAPLEAYCTAQVIGVGAVDVETDYLPHVIACENGAASQAALEAQAVAARSYLYYRLDTAGSIGDGTSDQVYTCGRPPDVQHFVAVESTSGRVLQYRGVQVAAFYVAGALQDPPGCRGGTDDPTGTEHYVTYNQGLSGDQIEQTTLGWVSPDNYANRGCMSQNGSDCLSDDGWVVDDILRFYYGEDIEMVDAVGACVIPGEPDAGAGPGEPDAAAGGGGDDGGLGGGCAAAGASGRPWWPALVAVIALARRRRVSAGRRPRRAGARARRRRG